MFSHNAHNFYFFFPLLFPILLLAWPPFSQGEGLTYRGKDLYVQYCAGCHGLNGNGQGEYASQFQIKPRDFTKGVYRFKSTPSGSPPLDSDLIRSIKSGIPGTAMVPQEHFSDADLSELVQYIKQFAPHLTKTKPGKPIVIPSSSFLSPEQIRQGQLAYQKSQCVQCHGSRGKGDGVLAKDLSIKPADLTKRPLRSGSTPQDLVRTILTGLDGTPMPAYQFILDDEEIVHISSYIMSLGGKPQETDDEKLGWKIIKQSRMALENPSQTFRRK